MTHTERAIDLLLFLQRYPRTFPDICTRYPETSERTLWRHLAELREIADLYQDDTGRYTIPVRMFWAGENRRPRARVVPASETVSRVDERTEAGL